jgi:diacylglycerol kinase family enzyme
MLAAVAGAVLIVNPYSTRVTVERAELVERVLRDYVELTVEHTRYPGHATELAAEATATSDAILVFSGDGTYNEALNGASGAVPFGFLPGGGTSVMPRALGYPRDPLEAAKRLGENLASGKSRRISVGSVNGRRFWFSAGLGLDGEAVRRLNVVRDANGGARPGDLAFAREFAVMAWERRGRWSPVLEIDGVGRAAFIFVANTDPYTYAGPFALHLTPGARFELGLDFVAAPELRLPVIGSLLVHALRGRTGGGLLRGHDLARIEVRCDRPLPLQADGEDLGDVERAVFETHRHAVTVIA